MSTGGQTWHSHQQFTFLTSCRKHINIVILAKIWFGAFFLNARQVLCLLLQIYATWRWAGLIITPSNIDNPATWRTRESVLHLRSTIFWDMTPCSPLSFNRRFAGTYRLHLQGRTYFFDPENGGDMFFRNVGWNSTDYTASYPRRWYSS
jgi:hypothetical protein